MERVELMDQIKKLSEEVDSLVKALAEKDALIMALLSEKRQKNNQEAPEDQDLDINR